MSGRQPLTVGTYGKITVVQIKPKVWEAITRFRDPDGTLRRVKRQSPTKTGAEARLKEALLERQHSTGAGELTGDTKLADAGQFWLATRRAEVDAGELAPRTYETYKSAWTLHVLPDLGGLRLREVTTARCEIWLRGLRSRKSASMCRTARATLAGVMGYAARLDAIPANPVRDVSRVPGGRTRQPRAMTRAEREQWLNWLDSRAAHDPKKPPPPRSPVDEQAIIASRALGDITRLMLATGCRIGEAMALSWDEVDLERGTVAIKWHLVRVTGEGLARMSGAKSVAGDRVLRIPTWCRDMLLRRRVESDGALPVFPDTRGQWRDPNWVIRWLRWSRNAAGFSWVTSHIFRMTVITVLDEAGLSTREVADQAGHSHVSQTHSYMQRGIASERAAEVLEGLL